jgi:hypothetical protein
MDMTNFMKITAAVACAFALTACGGGGGDSGNGTSTSNTLSRADEGIWSNLDNISVGLGMQAVILSDGSYWGVYGSGLPNGSLFIPSGVLQGTASVSGNSASGTYTDFFETGSSLFNGTYSGTVSAQNSLNLTFNDPSNPAPINSSGSNSGFNMSYDSIYNQPASLAAVAGNYWGTDCPITVGEGTGIVCGFSPGGGIIGSPTYTEQLTISGSNLTVSVIEATPNPGANEMVRMNGTLAPHGTAVNVFDVSLTATAISGNPYLPAGTVFKGILFQTSSGNTEIIATSGNDAFSYVGAKHN